MIRYSEQIVISLSDFWKALKRGRWTLFIVAASSALFFFCWQVKKPIHYTSKGVFKNSSGSSSINLPFFLKGGEFSSVLNKGDEHLSSLLKSLPILTQVVQKLHLQASLHGYEKKGQLQRLGETLQAEKSYFTYSTLKRPSSNILSGQVLVPDTLPFRDPTPPLLCTDISYAEETYTDLTLHFHDAQNFSVTNPRGQPLGEGQMNTPFTWAKGQFTLQNYGLNPQKTSTLQLTLIPLEKAALGLQNGLSVSRDKENPSLFLVQYTHSNRQLATVIVNAVMEEYSSYIKNEGEKKISQQLSYLSSRQEQSQAKYEKNLDTQRATLEQIVGEGGFLSLEKEIDFLTKNQVEYQKQLNHLHSEIQHLSSTLKDLPQSPATVDVFTTEAAEKLLSNYQAESDKLDFERAQYNHCLEKLSDPNAEVGVLAKAINDAALQELFDQVYSLNRKLSDEKNWSRGERENLKEEMEAQKKFLSFQLNNLKEALDLQERVLQGKILSLKQLMLSLLRDEYKMTETNLRDLALKTSSLPGKWASEKKDSLSLKLQKEFAISLAKLIESKNISYNLESLSAAPFLLATPASLPDNPKLFLYAHIGAIGGLMCALCFFFLRAVAKGPTSSAVNIRAAGYNFCGEIANGQTDDPAVKKAAHTLEKGVVFLSAGTPISCTSNLLTLLHKRQGSICLFTSAEGSEEGVYEYLEKNKSTLPLVKGETYDFIPWGKAQEFKEELVQSSRFQELLQKLKEKYDWVVFETMAPIDSIETKILASYADQILFVITAQPLAQLSALPEKTVFLLQSQPLTKESASLPKLPLRQLLPLLDALRPKTLFQWLNKG